MSETDDLARGNHVVPTEWAQQLERERNEARESLKHISEYGTDEINAAVELRQKLATALVERDEAREDADHWKIEYEIVVSRLCGIKHERDNGIITENEIIPVLRKERDEAREKAERYRREANKFMLQRDEAREALAVECLKRHPFRRLG